MLSVSELKRQRMSGPQKRTKSDFVLNCAQCYRLRSRKLDLPLSDGVIGPEIRILTSTRSTAFFRIVISCISGMK